MLASLWGALAMLAGVSLLLLALALTNLLVLPFGTALGIYAVWVLLTNEGRHLFETGS